MNIGCYGYFAVTEVTFYRFICQGDNLLGDAGT